MTRLQHNICYSFLNGALDAVDTTAIAITNAFKEGGVGGTNIATVASPNILVVTCEEEVMHVTAYTSGATSIATVLRGQEGTVAAAHPTGARIYNSPTKLDIDPIPPTVEVVVAASDAPADWITIADYLCDGLNDEVQLQSAATALGGNGVVRLSPGTFSIDAVVGDLWAAGQVTLKGSPALTWLEINYNAVAQGPEDLTPTAAVFTVSGYGAIMEGVGVYAANGTMASGYVLFYVVGSEFTMRDRCYLDEGGWGGTCVYTYGAGDQRLVINDCHVEGSTALHVTKQGLVITGSEIRTTGAGTGLRLRTAAGVGYGSYTGSKARITGNRFYGTGTHLLIDLNSSDVMGGAVVQGNLFEFPSAAAIKILGTAANQIIGNRITGPTEYGIWLLSAASHNIVKGNVIDQAGKHAIFLDTAHDNAVEGNVITNSSQTTSVTYSGIFLTASDRNSIQGNTIRKGAIGANRPLYGIRVDTSTCDGNIVANNDLTNASNAAGNELSDIGTGTQIGTAGRITVASSTAPAAEKGGATFICDGTNDEVQINAALALLGATTPGGKVYLSGGTFNIGAAITGFASFRHTLVGSGKGGNNATVLKRNVAGSFHMIDESATADVVRLEDLAIIDEGALATTGAIITASDIALHNCYVSNDRTGQVAILVRYRLYAWDSEIDADGIAISAAPTTAGLVQIHLTHCAVNSWAAAAVSDIETSLTISSNSAISLRDCTVYSPTAAIAVTGKTTGGFYPEVTLVSTDLYGDIDGCILANCTSVHAFNLSGYAGTGHFLKVENVDAGSIRDARIRGAGKHGIWLLDCNDIQVADSQVLAVGTLTDDTYSGILLDGDTNRCSVQDSLIRRGAPANKPLYGIRVDDATCDNNTIINNDLSLASKTTGNEFSDAGTGTVAGLEAQTLQGWFQDNAAASQTNVALVIANGRTEVPMPAEGYVLGVVAYSNEARTAGTLTAEPTINGTGVGLTAVLDGTNTTVKATRQGNGLDKFTAGQRIGVKITTDATWAPTTADIDAAVLVVYNTANRI